MKWLLFFPHDGSYAGEVNSEIGIKRKAAELILKDEKRYKQITLEPEGEGTMIASWGGTEVLVAQTERHPDVTWVAASTRRKK
ncbi:MAG TPA: hypothetical protein VFT30_03035 [Nitrospira sp.]|nr:hypothetical protein [Nitrospira sp.]